MKDRRFFLVLILLVLTGLMSYASAEETLIENEKARVVLKSFEQKNDTVEMKLFLENKTDKNVMFSIEDAVLNGWETNPFWAVAVSGGKKANETVTWRSISDDGVSTDVSIVDLHFNIYDSEDWMAEHYFEGKVTLMPMGAEQAHYDPYLLFCGLYAAKTSQNRQIQYIRFLMERDEKHVKIHEAFSYAGFSLTA